MQLVAAKFEGSVRASIPKCTTHGDIGAAGEFDQQSEEVLAFAAYQCDSDAGCVLSGGSAGSIIICPDGDAGVKKIRSCQGQSILLLQYCGSGCPTERLYALTSGRALIVIDIEADFLHSEWDGVDNVDLSASGGGGAVPTAVALVCDDEECLVLFGEETGVVSVHRIRRDAADGYIVEDGKIFTVGSSSVTSLAMSEDHDMIYVGTAEGEVVLIPF